MSDHLYLFLWDVWAHLVIRWYQTPCTELNKALITHLHQAQETETSSAESSHHHVRGIPDRGWFSPLVISSSSWHFQLQLLLICVYNIWLPKMF